MSHQVRPVFYWGKKFKAAVGALRQGWKSILLGGGLGMTLIANFTHQFNEVIRGGISGGLLVSSFLVTRALFRAFRGDQQRQRF